MVTLERKLVDGYHEISRRPECLDTLLKWDGESRNRSAAILAGRAMDDFRATYGSRFGSTLGGIADIAPALAAGQQRRKLSGISA